MLTLTALLLAVPAWAEDNQTDPEAMSQAMAEFYAGNWDTAIRSFDKIVTNNPYDTLAMAYMLDAYYRKQDIDAAISKVESESAAAGEDSDSRAKLGMAYFLRGKILPNVLDESLSEFKGSLQEDDKNSMAYCGTGLVYFQKRMMPRAKGYFVRALRLNPHDVMAMDRLGNIILVDEKKPAEAKDIFARIIQELPTYPDGHYFMGSALFDLHQYSEALPYLQRCSELDPKGYTQGYDAMTLEGDACLQLRRFPEAQAAFEKALKARPDSTYASYKLKLAQENKVSDKEELVEK